MQLRGWHPYRTVEATCPHQREPVTGVVMHLNNQRAVVRTLKAMRDTGRLERVDDALIVAALTTARHLDDATPGTTESAAAARVHLVALERLQAIDQRTTPGNDLIERITSVRDT
jgi:hypothetical protein